MVQTKFIKVELDKARRFFDEPREILWYSVLQDYARRFKIDQFGYIRIPTQVVVDDYGIDRRRAWRYNKALEDKGFIKIDKKHRGGHTWMGIRFI